MKDSTKGLSPRRQNVLWLRAAGYSQSEIAERLGISVGMVRKDNQAISRLLIPGLSKPQRGAGTLHRLTYALGLLDAGVAPRDIPDYLSALDNRVNRRLARIDRDLANTARNGQ